jgi:hypothetical protein
MRPLSLILLLLLDMELAAGALSLQQEGLVIFQFEFL